MKFKLRFSVLILFTVVLLVGVVSSTFAKPIDLDGPTQSPGEPPAGCLGEDSVIAIDQQSQLYSFVGSENGFAIPNPNSNSNFLDNVSSPEMAGRAYLESCGSLFGVQNQQDELTTIRELTTEDGRSVLRFQQTYQGVEVFAGQLVIQLTPNNNVLMINGEVGANLTLGTTPGLSANSAVRAAINEVLNVYEVVEDGLQVSEPELLIYIPELIGANGDPVLVWKLNVSQDLFPPVDQLVFVNAQDGSIELSIDQLHSVKLLSTYDANNGYSTTGATLVCTQADLNCSSGDTDEKNAHMYASDTYDFYETFHKRDSINDHGMIIKSYVHWGVGWCNAQWTGSYMRYGDGCVIVADDVVAHEMTHGVTSYESDLVYAYQSGAINESFSDIWGEWVDLTNGHGTDTTETRWQMGEDAYTVIRDLQDPTLYGDPDMMSSPYFYIGSDDAGGVHTNSGVGNKAAYLITDGDTFNGYNIVGLGIYKAAKIFYEVQTNILTSGSDYEDLGNGLVQACKNLIGTNGITSTDCLYVQKAAYATEMIVPVPYPQTPVGTIADSTPTYTWSRRVHGVTYQVQLKRGIFTVYNAYASYKLCEGYTCSVTPTKVLNNVTYKWRVRVKVKDVWGDWSAYKTFTVDAVSRPISPSGDTGDRTPTYVWTKQTDATNYQIELKRGLLPVYTKEVGSGVCGATTCSYTPENILNYYDFKWRVRGKVGGVWRAWSDYMPFTVVQNEGFYSSFNSNMAGWVPVNGYWGINNSQYLITYGVDQNLASAYYNKNFSTLNYKVNMRRTGCVTCANALYVRGTVTPLDYESGWYNGYYFAYVNDGYFSVWVFQNGVATALQPWTYTATINYEGFNTLNVVAVGNNLKFYINNVLVWSGNYAMLSSGKVGITMYRDGLGNQLSVDWAKLDTVWSFTEFASEEFDVGQIEVGGGTPYQSP